MADAASIRAWRDRSRRSNRLRPTRLTSDEIEERRRVREEVFRRDGWRCGLAGVDGAGQCFGRLTPHHKKKASQGGAFDPSNLVALCAHHNDQLEADADLAALARSLGLVLRRGD